MHKGAMDMLVDIYLQATCCNNNSLLIVTKNMTSYTTATVKLKLDVTINTVVY